MQWLPLRRIDVTCTYVRKVRGNLTLIIHKRITGHAIHAEKGKSLLILPFYRNDDTIRGKQSITVFPIYKSPTTGCFSSRSLKLSVGRILWTGRMENGLLCGQASAAFCSGL